MNKTSTTITSILKQLQSNNKREFWNISWSLCNFLSNIIKIKQPQNILEIGTSNGFSTICIAKGANKNSSITTIEINKERSQIAKKNFQKANLKNIKIINENIFKILEQNILKTKFDFIFLDAAQKDYKKIILKLENLKLINKNTIIICDNIKSHIYMIEFIEFMKLKYNVEELEINSGFLIAIKK